MSRLGTPARVGGLETVRIEGIDVQHAAGKLLRGVVRHGQFQVAGSVHLRRREGGGSGARGLPLAVRGMGGPRRRGPAGVLVGGVADARAGETAHAHAPFLAEVEAVRQAQPVRHAHGNVRIKLELEPDFRGSARIGQQPGRKGRFRPGREGRSEAGGIRDGEAQAGARLVVGSLDAAVRKPAGGRRSGTHEIPRPGAVRQVPGRIIAASQVFTQQRVGRSQPVLRIHIEVHRSGSVGAYGQGLAVGQPVRPGRVRREAEEPAVGPAVHAHLPIRVGHAAEQVPEVEGQADVVLPPADQVEVLRGVGAHVEAVGGVAAVAARRRIHTPRELHEGHVGAHGGRQGVLLLGAAVIVGRQQRALAVLRDIEAERRHRGVGAGHVRIVVALREHVGSGFRLDGIRREREHPGVRLAQVQLRVDEPVAVRRRTRVEGAVVDAHRHFREQAQAGRGAGNPAAGADLRRHVHVLDDMLVGDAQAGHFRESLAPVGGVQVPAVQAVRKRLQGGLIHREVRPQGLHQVHGPAPGPAYSVQVAEDVEVAAGQRDADFERLGRLGVQFRLGEEAVGIQLAGGAPEHEHQGAGSLFLHVLQHGGLGVAPAVGLRDGQGQFRPFRARPVVVRKTRGDGVRCAGGREQRRREQGGASFPH